MVAKDVDDCLTMLIGRIYALVNREIDGRADLLGRVESNLPVDSETPEVACF